MTASRDTIFSIIPNPKTLYVYDKPLLLGGKEKIVNPKEFGEENGFIWTEALHIHSSFHPNYTQGAFSSVLTIISVEVANSFFKKIDLEKNQGSLALCYMGKGLGYGVFARKDIPKGTYVASYAGEMNPISEQFPLNTHDNPYAILLLDKGEPVGSVCGKTYRNTGSFFQQLPKKNVINADTISIDQFQFENKIDIATENLEIVNYLYLGYPLLLYKTTCEIKKGQQMGWDYSKPYWKAASISVDPFLFNIQGDIIPRNAYKAKIITIYISIDNGTINIPLTHKQLEASLKNNLLIDVESENKVERVCISHDALNKAYKNIASGSMFMFFNNTSNDDIKVISTTYKDPDIISALKRITKQIEWKYYNEKNTAYLILKDKTATDKIAEYLKENGFTIRKDNTKAYIQVIGPDLTKLQATSTINTSNISKTM